MVSPLGLGTVKLGRNRGVKYPAPFEIPDDAASAELLRLAQKLGITLLDTAPAYGEAEERLGRILGASGGRDRWTLITKAGEEFNPETGESRYDFTPEAIRASVERSLRRLKTNHLDAVLLHSDGRDEWILNESGALDALQRLKKKGQTRLVGISTKTPEGALAATVIVDVIMITLNEGDQSGLPAIRAAAERGVGVLIKKAFAGGHGVHLDLLPDGRGSGGTHGIESALKLCYSQPGVSSVVIGTINPDHLKANAMTAEAILHERV